MHGRRAYPMVVVAALTVTLSGMVQADPIARPMQQGTKVVAAMCVAYAGRTSDPKEIGAQISQTLQELWTSCVDNGLHPAGPSIVAAETADRATQMVKWEAWLPLAEQPSADDLANRGPVPIRQIPQATVAFTYHVGDPGQIGSTFAALATWAGANGLRPLDRARVVVNMTPTDGKEEHFVRECQLELQVGAAAGQ
jgi:hypothetical protein